ncbi:MAG: 3-hydroxy-3-methylglutaryl-CoA reductase, partial [Nanoarchaeota archaeon]|nr:3-hydroxy-3-methylglutaryl-CoA reductase [Nanoarchaeota archaeon]
MATNSDDLRQLESYGDDAPKKRREFLKQKIGADLDSVSKGILRPSGCKANIENMIGSAQVPIGVAGPIKVKGGYAKGDFFIPLATTEGALVASVNRGCNAITASGGASVLIVKEGQTRSVLFKADDLDSVSTFLSYLDKDIERLKRAGEEDEPYINIVDIVPYVVGLNIWLRVSAKTGDAMGMNMVT